MIVNNPFLQKSKLTRQRRLMADHIRALEEIWSRLPNGPAKTKVLQRLHEARKLAKDL